MRLTLSEFVTVEQLPTAPGRKTAIWDVLGRSTRLGEIRWFSRWRCYALFPPPGTLFNSDCLNVLAQFCARATKEHRA
ncbi:MAG: hypothetical protein QOJ81_1328 [Chloroflexota bacterium]|jgi:hypothetical protein|nr:hypothetical protein [Chloroflexota bacterium]